MSSHNTRPEFSLYKTPARARDDIEKAKILSERLSNDAGLSIEADPEDGCDPYNTTGQHLILRAKKFPKK